MNALKGLVPFFALLAIPLAWTPGYLLLVEVVCHPAMALLAILAVYGVARALGMGQQLSPEMARDVDLTVTAGLFCVVGAYAAVCRGVGRAGLVITFVLMAVFLWMVIRRSGRVGGLALALSAVVWLSVGWRATHPLRGWPPSTALEAPARHTLESRAGLVNFVPTQEPSASPIPPSSATTGSHDRTPPVAGR